MLDDADGWMDGNDRGVFFDATLQPVGEWLKAQRDGGRETCPGGLCGGALTLTTEGTGHIWTMLPSIVVL